MVSKISGNCLISSNIFKVPSVFVKFNDIDLTRKFTDNVEVIAIFTEDDMTCTKASFALILSNVF